MVTEVERAKIDGLTAQVAQLAEEIKTVGATGDVLKVVEISGEYVKLTEQLVKFQRDARKDEIVGAEHAIIEGIKVILENSAWPSITGEEIHTVVYFIEADKDPQGNPIYGLQINPKRRKQSATATGGAKKTRSNVSVQRMGDNGEIEVLTVKEVVEKYHGVANIADDNSLLGKKAWSTLYVRVNKALEPNAFEDVPMAEVVSTE